MKHLTTIQEVHEAVFEAHENFQRAVECSLLVSRSFIDELKKHGYRVEAYDSRSFSNWWFIFWPHDTKVPTLTGLVDCGVLDRVAVPVKVRSSPIPSREQFYQDHPKAGGIDSYESRYGG